MKKEILSVLVIVSMIIGIMGVQAQLPVVLKTIDPYTDPEVTLSGAIDSEEISIPIKGRAFTGDSIYVFLDPDTGAATYDTVYLSAKKIRGRYTFRYGKSLPRSINSSAIYASAGVAMPHINTWTNFADSLGYVMRKYAIRVPPGGLMPDSLVLELAVADTAMKGTKFDTTYSATFTGWVQGEVFPIIQGF